MSDDRLREQLIRALDWEEAHVGFDKATANLPAAKRGIRPAGFEHSVWELLEHVRLAQWDLLDFCVNGAYEHTRNWPDDYWPKTPAPHDAGAWDESIASFVRDREMAKKVIRETSDLYALVPTGRGHQTFFRAILVLVDHTAYHAGQVVSVRRALDAWP